MPHSITTQVGGAIFILTCGAALALGRMPERLAAMLLLAQIIADNVLRDPVRHSPQLAIGAVDLLVLAGLGALMFSSQRRWLLWATAYQLVAVFAAVVRLLDPAVAGWAHVSVSIIAGYGVVVALAVGVARARRLPPSRTRHSAATTRSIR